MAKKKKEKKPLTPYQKHVQRELKKGKTMKQAAATWKKPSSKSTSKKPTRSTKSKYGGASRVANGGRKIRLNVSATDCISGVKLLEPAVPAVSSAIYYASKGLDHLAHNAPAILNQVVTDYQKADKFQMIGIPIILQIGKRIIRRLTGVNKLTGISHDGHYANITV